MIILGIDPGTTRIGYGLIKKDGNSDIYIASGLLDIGNKKDARSIIISLKRDLERILIGYKPEVVGLEKLFFSKNKKTAMAVAETRGVIIGEIGEACLEIKEIAPVQVKFSVTGSGSASKQAVSKMVTHFLKISTEKMIDDEVDALAVALAVSFSRDFRY